MVLVLDMGNTNILAGCFEGDALLFTSRLHTAQWRTADEWAILLGDLLRARQIRPEQIEGAIVSSVVPNVTGTITDCMRLLTGRAPLIIGPGLKTGLDILIENPAQLGSDMVCNSVAALHKHTPPFVIFDMGTATSVSVLDEKGRFLGGAIVPGVRTSLEALSARAAQLPHIALEVPQEVIGKNTVSCMQSGVLHGAAAMVEGMSSRIEAELGQPATVLLTGGLSELIAPLVRREVRHEPNLLLEGLHLIYRKNTARKSL